MTGPGGVLAAPGAGEAAHCPSPLRSRHTGLLQALALPLPFLFNPTHLQAPEDEPAPPWTSPVLSYPAPQQCQLLACLSAQVKDGAKHRLRCCCSGEEDTREQEFRADGST